MTSYRAKRRTESQKEIFQQNYILSQISSDSSHIKIATCRWGLEDDNYAISTITNNPGIYSDRWGSLRTHQTAWSLVTHIDLSKFLQRRVNLNSEWLKLSQECHYLSEHCTIRNQLTAILTTMRTLAEEQRDIEELTQNYQEPDYNRRKRAPLSFIGTISRALFGTLDAEDAEFYNERIESLENDTRSMIELIANQTHVIKSQFNEDRMKIEKISLDFYYKFANVTRRNADNGRDFGGGTQRKASQCGSDA